MGDGETTGLVTGIDVGTFDRLRESIRDLAEVTRLAGNELYETHIPAIEAARIEEWGVVPKLAYELILGTLRIELEAAGLGAGTSSATYEGLNGALALERVTQFPLTYL